MGIATCSHCDYPAVTSTPGIPQVNQQQHGIHSGRYRCKRYVSIPKRITQQVQGQVIAHIIILDGMSDEWPLHRHKSPSISAESVIISNTDPNLPATSRPSPSPSPCLRTPRCVDSSVQHPGANDNRTLSTRLGTSGL